jgi:hypothetical protein
MIPVDAIDSLIQIAKSEFARGVFYRVAGSCGTTKQEEIQLQNVLINQKGLMLREMELARQYQQMEQQQEERKLQRQHEWERFFAGVQANRSLESYKQMLYKWPFQGALPESIIARATQAKSHLLNVFVFDGDKERKTSEMVHNKIYPTLHHAEFGDHGSRPIILYANHTPRPNTQEDITTLWDQLRFQNCLVLQVEQYGKNTHRIYCNFWAGNEAQPSPPMRYMMTVQHSTEDQKIQMDLLCSRLWTAISYIADLVAFLYEPLKPEVPKWISQFSEGFFETDRGIAHLPQLKWDHATMLSVYQNIPHVGVDYTFRLARAFLSTNHKRAAYEHLCTSLVWLVAANDAETNNDPSFALQRLRTQSSALARKWADEFSSLMKQCGYCTPESTLKPKPYKNLKNCLESVL